MAHGQLDVAALYAALDAERRARDLSWRRLAHEVGVSPSTLTRLANGHRPDVDAFAALVHWLGVPAGRFLSSDRPRGPEPDLLTQLAPLLRARRDLTAADVDYLEDLIAAAVKRFRSEHDQAGQAHADQARGGLEVTGGDVGGGDPREQERPSGERG